MTYDLGNQRGTMLKCPHCGESVYFGAQLRGINMNECFDVTGKAWCCSKSVTVRFGAKMTIEGLTG